MTSVNIMIDFETLGTSANTVALSLGATIFTLNPNKVLDTFSKKISASSMLKEGFTVNPDTISWWIAQSPDAKKVFSKNGAVPYKKVLQDFHFWVLENRVKVNSIPLSKIHLWSNGADFDIPLLKTIYEKADLHEYPFNYLNHRCFRTIKNEYSNIKSGSKPRHDALADAIAQTKHLFKIQSYKNKLKLKT